MKYFTLNAHKKCIGQTNFDPLLYYKFNNNKLIQQHSLYLDQVGTYEIKYVSGAICSFNIDIIKNQLCALTSIIPKLTNKQVYWNRYYQSNLLKLGNYDITYFPTSSILLACFQCQFGTLPGFTDKGYLTKSLADTFNSNYLANPNNKYNFTDSLTFTIQYPQEIIFWYTNITQQSVEGQITYSINVKETTNQTYYLNDISLIGVNKTDISQYSFQDYYINLKKYQSDNKKIENTQKAWIQDLNYRYTIKDICDFNTVGYSSAYLNDIIYTDTLNYSKQYSTLYSWQLIQKINSSYQFIVKFNNNSPSALLYPGVYSIFLANNNDYKFNKDTNINELIIQSIPYLSANNTNGQKIIWSFQLNNITNFPFTFLCATYNIYLYKGLIDIDNLYEYIQSIKTNNEFIIQYNKNISLEAQKILDNSISELNNIIEYNENIYNYYIDIANYIYYQQTNPIQFTIYTAQKIKNYLSIGPYPTLNAASSIIDTKLFPQLSEKYTAKIIKNQDNNNLLNYTIIYTKNQGE